MTQIINRGGNGRLRKKQKFKSAEEAKRARENDAAWSALQAKWAPSGITDDGKWTYSLSGANRDTGTKHKSLNTGDGIAAAKEIQQYTGTEMIGIGQLHKSNAIPVFKEQEAKDLASMRR
jgi:hypothetical protein